MTRKISISGGEMKKYFVIFSIFIILSNFNISQNNSAQNTNYLKDPGFFVSIFRNYYGFIQWKKDILSYYMKDNKKVQLNNFNESILMMRDFFIRQKKYGSDNNVYIPVLYINKPERSQNRLKIYSNGMLLSPKKIHHISRIYLKINDRLSSSPPYSSLVHYDLVVYTFAKFIAHKYVVFSLRDEKDFSQSFYIDKGFQGD